MNFQIMKHVGGRDFVPAVHIKTKKALVYDCPKKAAEVAAKLTKVHNVKHQPHPVVDMGDLTGWRDRERNRFKSGDYKPVLWIDEPWWKELPDQFAHIGVKDPSRIAFTPDANKGDVDRQTAMLPGKYLQQFFGDVLNAEQVRKHAMEHSNKFEINELKFATTVEDIQRVYKPHLGSCFGNTTKANLYASGDFAIAYIEKDDKVTARAVCCPARKIHVRIYGDSCRLSDLLEKAGYTKDSTATSYKGLRLLKKWMWNGFYSDWYPNRDDFEPDPKDDQYLIIS